MTFQKLVSIVDDAGLATLDRSSLARSAALSLPPDVDLAAQIIDRVPDLPLDDMTGGLQQQLLCANAADAG